MYKKSTEMALAFKFETEHLHIFLVWKNLTVKCGCWLNNKKESPSAVAQLVKNMSVWAESMNPQAPKKNPKQKRGNKREE